MSEDFLLDAVVHYFKTLDLAIQSKSSLYNGITIAQFLSTAEGSQIAPHQIMKDENIYGAALSNFKLIKGQIDRLRQINSKQDIQQDELTIHEIYTDKNEKQLIKLLKQCFVLVFKLPNNSYFIQKILTLPQNEQLIFVKLLQQDGKLSQSTYTKQNPQSQKCDTKDTNHYHDLDLFDKYCEIQIENERLQQQLKKWMTQSNQMYENNLDLSMQVQTLKSYTQNLKHELLQANETLLKLRNRNQKQAEKQNKNNQTRIQMQKILDNYKQQIDFMNIQSENNRKKYETKIKQLELQLKKQKQFNQRIRQQLQFSQKQLEQIINKYRESEIELKKNKKQIGDLCLAKRELQEAENALKFEVHYKNSQIQQLKEMVLNNSNTTVGKDDYDSLSNAIKSPRNLAIQFGNSNGINNCISPRSNTTSILQDFEELKTLKLQVKQLQKQNAKLTKLKSRNKQLEYQKNKLLKILKDYEATRGEQNDIITGCLYELQMKFMAGNKASNSTISSDCSI